jgi:hypothetical protein
MAQNITCPHCGANISVDEVLSHQIREEVSREVREKSRIEVEARLKEEFKLQIKDMAEAAAEEKERTRKLTEQITELMKAKKV